MDSQHTNSLSRTASWVIRNRWTKEVVCETWSEKFVTAINMEKYEAIPIGDYLAEINYRIREGRWNDDD